MIQPYKSKIPTSNQQAKDITCTIFHNRFFYCRFTSFRPRVQFLRFLLRSNLNKTSITSMSCFLGTMCITQLTQLKKQNRAPTGSHHHPHPASMLSTPKRVNQRWKTLPPGCVPRITVVKRGGRVGFFLKKMKNSKPQMKNCLMQPYNSPKNSTKTVLQTTLKFIRVVAEMKFNVSFHTIPCNSTED